MIKNKANNPKYIWGENCVSWILNNADNLIIKQEVMPPNTTEQLHYHQNATQFFFILKGEATFQLEEQTVILFSSDGISVAPLQKHKIYNDGGADLEFLVISTSVTESDRILAE